MIMCNPTIYPTLSLAQLSHFSVLYDLMCNLAFVFYLFSLFHLYIPIHSILLIDVIVIFLNLRWYYITSSLNKLVLGLRDFSRSLTGALSAATSALSGHMFPIISFLSRMFLWSMEFTWDTFYIKNSLPGMKVKKDFASQ